MSQKVIKFTLDAKGIDRAIKEVQQYKAEFLKKVDIYRKRLAEEIATRASQSFASSMVDDVIYGGGSRRADVQVSVSDKGTISVVVADGEDAVWCEFGAGVYHNGSVGSSPNPYGNDLGFTIGSYGKGYGKGQAWGYYTDPNSKTGLVITRGTPASMPMYNAAQEVLRKSVEIAREVFG
jgi:hypothetical protein